MCSHDEARQKRHKKERMLEICILTLVNHEMMHGYRILELLQRFGYQPEDVDISTVYRTLHRLENHDRIISTWEDSSLGPNKRIYAITETGRRMLADHIEHMKQRMQVMKQLIDLNEGKMRLDLD